MTIKAVVTKTEEKEITISTASFWKEPTSSYGAYRAVLDEKTFIEVLIFWGGEIVDITHSTPERRLDKILEASEKWGQIDESEFMRVYDDVYESMRLKPALVTTGETYDAIQELRQSEIL